MTCPECELNKARAALWRHEAYKHAGTVLPWNVDEAIAKAVAAEREECAKVCEETVAHHYMKQVIPAKDEAMLLAACADCAAAIRSRNAASQ